jgi:hypothetical protein
MVLARMGLAVVAFSTIVGAVHPIMDSSRNEEANPWILHERQGMGQWP